MGAGTPGKPVPGEGKPIRPPAGDGRPRPPKEVIFPIAGDPPSGKPGIRPPKLPKEGKSPEIFDKLLEGIKKGKPFGGRGGKPVVSRPLSDFEPGERPLDPSDILNPPRPKIVMGPDDRPVEVWPWGREDDPDYDRKKKEYFEKKMGPMPKSEPFGTGPMPKGPFGGGLADGGRPPKPRSFPVDPRTLPTYRDDPFTSGIFDGGGPRPPRPPRKEAVVFGGKPSSTESKRPTKGSPKGGMTKAGPVDAEAKNKFEEMLAYMKRFQK